MPEALDKQLLISPKLDNSATHCYGACRSRSPSGENSENAFNDNRKSASPCHTVDKSLTWSQKKLLVGMVLVSLLNGSLVAVMIPFFPVEAASRGVPQATISAVFSCFATVQMILSPIVGRVAPVIGITRLYNIGIAIAGVTTIVFGALNHIGDTQLFVAACFLMRVVEAAGMTAVSGCAFTIIANQFQERTSRIVALIGAAQSIGMSVAPAIGSGLYALAGFALPFYVTGGTMVGAGVLNYWFMPPLDRYQRPLVPYSSMLRVFSKSWQNWLCLLNVFHFSFVLLTFDTSMAPYADKALGITPSTMGLYFTVATVAYALTSFMWARITESSRHPHAFISLCLLVTSVSLLLIPPSPLLDLTPRWWLFGLGMTLMEGSVGAAFIPCFPLLLAAGLQLGLPNDLVTQSFLSSVLWTAHSLGCVVGPPIGGLIVDLYGFPVMMTCLAGLVLLVSMLNMTHAVSSTCHRTTKVVPSSSSDEEPSERLA